LSLLAHYQEILDAPLDSIGSGLARNILRTSSTGNAETQKLAARYGF